MSQTTKQAFIDNASSNPIIDGAILIKQNNIPNGVLLENDHPLIGDCINNIKNNESSITADHFKTYIALSSIVHSMDGWEYLASAIEAIVNGNHSVAIHLAYYSELRGSMSFLATEGIGIFDKKHFNLNSVSALNPSSEFNGTHQAVWLMINLWTNSAQKPENSDILSVFSVSSKTFQEWVEAFPYATTLSAKTIIQKWIQEWNLDVDLLQADRNTRNEVSYRPQRNTVNSRSEIEYGKSILEIQNIWELIEPSETNRFNLLDRHLLKLFLRRIYDSLAQDVKDANSFDDLVTQTLTNLGLPNDDSFSNFLRANSRHSIFDYANKNAYDIINNKLNVIAILSRALLMLRLSTGCASLIFKKARYSIRDLNVLWEIYGVENGFWKTGEKPENFEDLWDEINDHLETIKNWLEESEIEDLVANDVLKDEAISHSIKYFKQIHRAMLWGFYL